MKALMGKLAIKVRKDKKGREELRRFLSESQADEMVIVLSSGERYRVSRHNPEEQNPQPA